MIASPVEVADPAVASLPRILVIDDLFGRNLPDGRNPDRENLCANFLWRDASGDAAALSSRQHVTRPVAEAVFCRGQVPLAAHLGDFVENDLAGALATVREGWEGRIAAGDPPWALVLLDLCFYTGSVTPESMRSAPGMPEGRISDDRPDGYFGLALLEEIHRSFPELPILIMSSKPREEISREFVRRGALGFIARDDPDGTARFEQALWQNGLVPDETGDFVGHSLAVLLTLREARRASGHRGNLLIRGERGSGKEVLAAYTHRMSALSLAAVRPFVAVNSATLQNELFSAELFGIEPKTASGVDGKIGFIEAANGGDLFLDEIADMPAEGQAALLRVMQDRKVIRIGSRRALSIDVRFLAATNAAVEDERLGFRADLLDRLRMGGTLWLPPLRERPSDIPLLATRIVREAESQRAATMRRDISPEAMALLRAHPWRGNVRELRACLLDAVYRYPDVEHLVTSHLRLANAARTSVAVPVPLTMAQPPSDGEPGELDDLIGTIDRTRFDAAAVEGWSGRLGELQLAQTRLSARYLAAALAATKRRTPDAPNGIVQIHPAMKLLTGDSGLSASSAADAIKRMLGPIENELDGDLAQAMATAVKLRPRSPKASSGL